MIGEKKGLGDEVLGMDMERGRSMMALFRICTGQSTGPYDPAQEWNVLDHAVPFLYHQMASADCLFFEYIYTICCVLRWSTLQFLRCLADAAGFCRTNRKDNNLSSKNSCVRVVIIQNFGDMLYNRLVTALTQQLREMANTIESVQEGLFLEELNQKWVEHNIALQMIQDCFLYMEKLYIPKSNRAPVSELGFRLWRDHVVRSAGIAGRLQSALNDFINAEQTGKVIDMSSMHSVMKMLEDLNKTVFREDPFLSQGGPQPSQVLQSEVLRRLLDIALEIERGRGGGTGEGGENSEAIKNT